MSNAAAGTNIQRWGWRANRSARYAISPQPRPNASSTEPVTSGSEPSRATSSTRTMARTAPATMDTRITGTRERVRLRWRRTITAFGWLGMREPDGRLMDAGSPRTAFRRAAKTIGYLRRTQANAGYLTLSRPSDELSTANLVVHFEIHASEPQKLIDFYSSLFGSQFQS